jgi:hypothetical protein
MREPISLRIKDTSVERRICIAISKREAVPT